MRKALYLWHFRTIAIKKPYFSASKRTVAKCYTPLGGEGTTGAEATGRGLASLRKNKRTLFPAGSGGPSVAPAGRSLAALESSRPRT